MADVSKIKLPSGTTYNIKDTISGYTTNTGTITKVQTTAGAHTTINVSSGAATFNVPTKTSHLTNDSGFLTNSTLYEGRLNWGNINLAGNVTPVGMSLSAEHSANRIAYLNPAAITIEYTTDGGSNWLDSGYTDDEKTWLCTGSTGIAVGQSKSEYSSSTALTTNHWTRITLTGQNGSAGYVYTSPRKLLINVGSALGLSCLIEYKTGVSGANWQTFGTYAVSGWSDWNDIPLILGTFGGGSNQTGNTWYLRFTFKITSTRTDAYKGYSQILGLRLFGATDWGSASSNNSKGPFSSTGHLYSYDVNANATFPAKVTATSFSGPLTGNVTGNVSGTAANVTGTVAIAHGGTGQTTAANAINALLNGLPVWTADPTDTTYFVRQDTGGSATYGKVQATTLWNYISGKLPAWSKASTKPSYNFSEIGSTPTTLSGYGITDAKIASGTITLGSNTITPLTSSSTLNAAKLSGAIPSAVTATTQTAGDNSTKIATTAFVSSAISGLPTPMQFIGTVGTNGTTTWANLPAASGHNGYTYKVITAHTAETGKPAADVGDVLVSNGTEWIVIPAGDETATQSATTGISIAAHGTGTVIGVQSTTTTASKVTVGSSSTDYGVKSAGSASTWTFEEKTIPNVTAAGSGSASLTFTMDTTDTKKLKITFSHTHTAPTLGTAIKVQSKSGGANGSAPTLGSKVPTVSASDVTVPIKNASASTFVTGTTHTITDNGHTHTI